MNSKKIFFLSLLLFGVITANAQVNGDSLRRQRLAPKTDTWSDIKEKSYFGGSLGAWFGNNASYVNISPMAGYTITEKLSAGVGGTYMYLGYRNPEYKINIYGGRVFGRYNILPYLFAYGEYEVLNGPWDYKGNRFNVPGTWVGGGYSQNMGGGASTYLLVLYNPNPSIYSPFSNPQIRFGFSFGFNSFNKY